MLLPLVLGCKMVDSASESDSSSLDGGAMLPPNTVSRDQLQKRIESLQQQNRSVENFVHPWNSLVVKSPIDFWPIDFRLPT